MQQEYTNLEYFRQVYSMLLKLGYVNPDYDKTAVGFPSLLLACFASWLPPRANAQGKASKAMAGPKGLGRNPFSQGASLRGIY